MTTRRRPCLRRKKRLTFGLLAFAVAALLGFFSTRYLAGGAIAPDYEVYVMRAQNDGKVLLGGRFTNGLIRMNADGTADDTLSKAWWIGGFNGAVWAIAIQPDGKILVGGEFTRIDISLAGFIARINPDGTLDDAFSAATGTGFDDRVSVVAVQGDGKILVGGQFLSFNGARTNRVARLNLDGTLDPSFDSQVGFDGPVFGLSPLEGGGVAASGDFKSYRGTVRAHFAILKPDASL